MESVDEKFSLQYDVKVKFVKLQQIALGQGIEAEGNLFLFL